MERGPTTEELGCANGFVTLTKRLVVSATDSTPAKIKAVEYGAVYGGGQFPIGSLAYGYAVPQSGYRFSKWRGSNGRYEITSLSPLIQIPVSGCEMTFRAEFYAEPPSGDPGTNPPPCYTLVNGSTGGDGGQGDTAPLAISGYVSGFEYEGAILNGADLTGVLFGDDKVQQPFAGASLQSANLTGINLQTTYRAFYNADLVDAILVGVDFSSSGAAFDSALLVGANLSGVQMGSSSKSLVQAYLVNADFSEANFGSSVSAGSESLARAVNLAGADLASSKGAFTYSNLAWANLAGVIFGTSTGAFGGANLAGVISGGIVGEDRLITDQWMLRGGYVVGPQVNLSGANLSGVNLSGVNLLGAILDGASGSNIQTDTDTIFPNGWSVSEGTLFYTPL